MPPCICGQFKCKCIPETDVQLKQDDLVNAYKLAREQARLADSQVEQGKLKGFSEQDMLRLHLLHVRCHAIEYKLGCKIADLVAEGKWIF